MYMYSFEKLEVWQAARMLVKLTYETIHNNLPQDERYVLADQMKRSAISISSNIAEGTSRLSAKEKIRFLEVAYGSLMELYAQFILCVDFKYLDDGQFSQVAPVISKISNLLNSLKTAYAKQLNK